MVFEGGSPRRYDADFRRSAVELSSMAGRTVVSVAEELGVPVKTLEHWRAQERRRAGRGGSSGAPATLEAAQEQLRELRRQLGEAEADRDILKKALAICSRNTGSK